MGVLDGQVAIVTGGGTGIGRAAAERLAAQGARVVVAGRRREPLDEAVAAVAASGGRAWARSADLTSREAAEGLVHWTEAEVGPPAILVHSAGESSRVRDLRWLAPEEWERVVAINLTATAALVQATLPGMLARGGGTIVTVSSLAALRPGLLSGPVYGAAKAGARALMQFVHNAYRNQGIRATTIVPAEVDTPILDKRPRPPSAEERARMMGADDVARAILLCCTLPSRTVIEEIIMSPTVLRDQSADLAYHRTLGAPPGWREPAGNAAPDRRQP